MNKIREKMYTILIIYHIICTYVYLRLSENKISNLSSSIRMYIVIIWLENSTSDGRMRKCNEIRFKTYCIVPTYCNILYYTLAYSKKINPWRCSGRFMFNLNFISVFSLFQNYLPLQLGQGLNSDHPRMLSAKFG